MKGSKLISLLLCPLVVLCPLLASSEQATEQVNEEEIEIEAEHVDIDREEGRAVFEGGVVLRHGSLQLRCAQLVAEVDDRGRLSRIDATGGVQLSAGDVSATAGRATYAPSTGVLTLSGQPRLRHPSGDLRGRVIVFRSREGRVSVEEARGVFRFR